MARARHFFSSRASLRDVRDAVRELYAYGLGIRGVESRSPLRARVERGARRAVLLLGLFLREDAPKFGDVVVPANANAGPGGRRRYRRTD